MWLFRTCCLVPPILCNIRKIVHSPLLFLIKSHLCLQSLQDEAGPLPKKDVNLLESDIFDPLAEDQKPDPPAPPASNPASNPAAASRSPRHAYSHPDYEERPDGGQRDEVDHRGGAAAAAGNASIVPTQKMLQDKYEQNLRCECFVALCFAKFLVRISCSSNFGPNFCSSK